MGVSSLFAQALELQRRASGITKIQENALFVTESISREVRVSSITSGNTNCNPPDIASRTLTMKHPVNGDVTYTYDPSTGSISRSSSAKGGTSELISSGDVFFTSFAFCVSGAGVDGQQVRITMPMTIRSTTGKASSQFTVSLQTTIVSRDLSEELTH
jgi:hypothetical protein